MLRDVPRSILSALCATALLAGLAGCASPTTASAPVDEAAAARSARMFERLKDLEGTWVSSGADAAMEGAELRYRVTSGGSAVIETIFPGAQHEMVSVYTLDNGRLVMTHYCAMGNQPFMVARTDTDEDTIHFVCERAGNTGSHADPHMHEGVFTLGDGTLHAEWTMFKDLDRRGTVVIDLVRADG